MKNLVTTLALTLLSSAAFAIPGQKTLTCKTGAQSGSKQKVEFKVQRYASPGLAAASFEVTLDGKKTSFTSEDDQQQFGSTIHNSPLGVIQVTASTSGEWNPKVQGSFSVTAIPATVKAYDLNGKLVKWNLKAEREECYDANGRATFKGVFHGWMAETATSTDPVEFDTQILECELVYDSGSAC